VILVADTSGLIAASDKNAPESAGCQAALAAAGTVLVSPLVLTEVDHLAKARFGSDARSTLIDFIVFQARRERFLIPEITLELLELARKVQRQYAGLDLDLADGVNAALAAEYRTCSMLTLDRRDFRAIRPLTPHPAFQLLPDDM
jgi:predicted nucleic acid-binding protein